MLDRADRADRVRVRVATAAGATTLTVGFLGESTDRGARRLADAHRGRRPGVEVRVRETDLTDPTCGPRAGLVDVALTRGPFDETGLTVHELRADPVGAVLRADDPPARRDRLTLSDPAGRRWFRFPAGTDPLWQAYWNGGQRREGPVVRGVQECVQAVLWKRHGRDGPAARARDAGGAGRRPGRRHAGGAGRRPGRRHGGGAGRRPGRRHAGGAGRRPGRRHGAEPRAGGVAGGRQEPADQITGRDRDGRVSHLTASGRRGRPVQLVHSE
ncbi:LysR substrate-binding domain-containing protein [Streptomyces sp. bgisy027]|uniref:LysR substrate-binding domain-containing protein n=1 Tax=Streptomyces sp. bgisy027 TaxID=3413770 RepID=UPI003D72FB3A